MTFICHKISVADEKIEKCDKYLSQCDIFKNGFVTLFWHMLKPANPYIIRVSAFLSFEKMPFCDKFDKKVPNCFIEKNFNKKQYRGFCTFLSQNAFFRAKNYLGKEVSIHA